MNIIYGKQAFGRVPIKMAEARRTADAVLRELVKKDLLPIYGGDPDVVIREHGGDEVIVTAQPGYLRVRVNTRQGGFATMTAKVETPTIPTEEVCVR